MENKFVLFDKKMNFKDEDRFYLVNKLPNNVFNVIKPHLLYDKNDIGKGWYFKNQMKVMIALSTVGWEIKENLDLKNKKSTIKR